MRQSLVVVTCDGEGCVEAIALNLEDGLDAQLRGAGWCCSTRDGADLCPMCSRVESARLALAERLQRPARVPLLAVR